MTIKNKRVVITGGAGFIGSHIVEELYRDNEAIIIDDLSTGKLENIEPFLTNKHVRFVNGSITDLPLLQSTFQGADYIFHEAAVTSVPKSISDPLTTNEVNIKGTLNVLTAARDNKAKKVGYASSSAVYGNNPNMPLREEYTPQPLSPYAVSKITGEYYCKIFSEIYGLSTVSLRYFNVYGPRQDPESQYAAVIPIFIRKLLAKESPVIYGDGEQTRDFIFVKDVVTANILTVSNDITGSVNVGSGKTTTINSLANILSELLEKNTGGIKPIRTEPRQGDPLRSQADINKINAFNFIQQYTLEKSLEITIKYHRQLA
ncbi:MAG TPA: GDP-mannose 4,6-dehydratase [Desulfotomaculum sp.]|nr:MAG: Nucleoside-diphosphate-sugar epimerase [Desulfotomaculum sp. 46_80]KUK85165.1 MAG: Nucleoside-diphosphate-sugar epimerase [Desulfofundulus kuznetsovii]HAG12183.1 GDP-mannose 4,6-dehydratase [Desulfotomaculum sp.]HBY04388.1 GDP-mannose 4,6-dehydratase [Desulfotomaculum sp.]